MKNKKGLWIIVAIFFLVGIVFLSMSSKSTVLPQGINSAQAKEFEDFYKDKTPMKFEMWQMSAHGENGVTCVNCHENGKLSEDELTYENFAKVKPETCGKCHKEEFEGWKDTRHVEAVSFSQNNVRYKLLNGWPAMQQQGCDACHVKVGETCTSCHQGHTTALPKPQTAAHEGQEVTGDFLNGCGDCHMGPDHPQREAYESSVHYKVAQTTGGPTCVTCHTDPENNHAIIQLKNENGAEGRDKLWSNCLQCHTKEYTDNARANVEQIKKETLRVVADARAIIRDLYKDGILEPTQGSMLDAEGLPPLTAKSLGYSHVSQIESLMFELHKYAEATTIKGAQHFSPDYTHWHGAGDLWSKYEAIKAEAERLRLEADVQEKTGVQEEKLPMFKYEKATGKELETLKK